MSFTFFKLRKWSQIVQNITYVHAKRYLFFYCQNMENIEVLVAIMVLRKKWKMTWLFILAKEICLILYQRINGYFVITFVTWKPEKFKSRHAFLSRLKNVYFPIDDYLYTLKSFLKNKMIDSTFKIIIAPVLLHFSILSFESNLNLPLASYSLIRNCLTSNYIFWRSQSFWVVHCLYEC